jgi:hypothetical protein
MTGEGIERGILSVIMTILVGGDATMPTLLGLSEMKSNKPFAPLALLGYCLQQRDVFASLREQVQLEQKCIVYTPYDK